MKFLKFLKIVLIIICVITITSFIVLPFFYKSCDTESQKEIYDFYRTYYSYGILTIIGAIGLLFLLWYKYKSKYGLLKMLIFAIISILFIVVIMVSLGSARITTYDQVRVIRHLRSIETMLNIFYIENGRYPENLEELQKIESVKFEVPRDPATNQPYEYGTNEQKDSYVIKAVLDNYKPSDSCYNKMYTPFLGNDIDGEVFGVDCNDPAYCMAMTPERKAKEKNRDIL